MDLLRRLANVAGMTELTTSIDIALAGAFGLYGYVVVKKWMSKGRNDYGKWTVLARITPVGRSVLLATLGRA